MKQFYFGNDRSRGYSVLAQSEGLDGGAAAKMRECAEQGLGADETERLGMLPCRGGMIIFKISRAAPRVSEGENRPTFFSHQYFVGESEMYEFAQSMPQVVGSLGFESGYSPSYDVRDIYMSAAGEQPQPVSPELRSAAEEVIAKGTHMLIYGRSMDCAAAQRLMTALMQSLDINDRKKVSFTAVENEKSGLTGDMIFIFCSMSGFEKLKQHFTKGCVYYNADSGGLVSTDVVKKPTQPELHFEENGGNSLNGQNFSEQRQDRTAETLKRLAGVIIAAAVLASVAASALTAALVGRAWQKKLAGAETSAPSAAPTEGIRLTEKLDGVWLPLGDKGLLLREGSDGVSIAEQPAAKAAAGEDIADADTDPGWTDKTVLINGETVSARYKTENGAELLKVGDMIYVKTAYKR